MPYYPSPAGHGDPKGPEEKQKREPRERRLRIGLVCLSTALVLYGGIRLALYGADLLSSRRTSRELREALEAAETAAPEAGASETLKPFGSGEPGSPGEDPAEAEEPESAGEAPEGDAERTDSAKLPEVPYPNGLQVSPRIQQLRKKSGYILGWIRMDDLDEPVVRKDNTFFLDHDAMGKKNVNGALFFDEETALFTRPYTLLIYGHNMKTGAMFGNLQKYRTYAYCYQHRLLSLETLYEEGRYQIFSVADISLIPGTARYVSLTDLQSSDRVKRRKALDTLGRLSAHGRMTEVSEEDQVVLLITCTGDDDERLVVAARRLRDGETGDAAPSKGNGRQPSAP